MIDRVRRGRRAEHAAEMRRVVEEFERGDVSQARFCRERGLAVSTFLYWRRRSGAANRQEFSEIEIVAPPNPSPPDVCVELVLPGGVIVRLRGDADESTIRRILRAVSPSC